MAGVEAGVRQWAEHTGGPQGAVGLHLRVTAVIKDFKGYDSSGCLVEDGLNVG